MPNYSTTASLTVSGCRLRTCGAEIVSDLDKSIAQFYQGRLTTAMSAGVR